MKTPFFCSGNDGRRRAAACEHASERGAIGPRAAPHIKYSQRVEPIHGIGSGARRLAGRAQRLCIS